MYPSPLLRTFRLATLAGVLACTACATTDEDPTSRTDEVTASSPSQDPAPSSGPVDPCTALASELAELLAAAQRCHVAAANPIQCATWVPSTDGCSQPVAYPGSDEVKAYLARFEVYAAGCPLPDRPCLDPSLLAVDCTQSPNIDGAFGRCAILE